MPSVEEIQQALEIVAYAVEVHGEVYAPILERLDLELRKATEMSPARARAREILQQAQMRSGGFSAIRPSISAFCASEGPSP